MLYRNCLWRQKAEPNVHRDARPSVPTPCILYCIVSKHYATRKLLRKQTKEIIVSTKKNYSSTRVSSTRPLTLLLLLFFEIFMKLSLFFTLPVRDDSDLSLF